MRYLLTILLTLTFYTSLAQDEARHWFFGNGAGIVFDLFSGDVNATNAAANTINTGEGCASISDFNGNLLFYTDGRSVWNKEYELMPNGDYFGGSGLLGDPSSTSSAIIIPKPGSTRLYYIFTVDEPHQDNAAAYPNQFTGNYSDNGGSVPTIDNGFNDGLTYSLLNLDLENGLGDVVTSEKNVQLVTYNPFDNTEASYKCSEKVTAVAHADGNAYWVVTHFKNKFYAFKVDENGVNPNPVISTVGPNITTNGYRRNSIGYMKISPDGSKLAICHNENGNATGQNSYNTGSFWLFNFNNTTGSVSSANNLVPNIEPYGTEFSPDSKKLYVSYAITSDILPTEFIVRQFDLSTTNITSIIIPRGNSSSIRSMQLAPNGKIYLCNTSTTGNLDVINAPNEEGAACDYTASAVALANGTNSKQGLPSFIQSILLTNIRAQYLCLGDFTEFSITSNDTIIDILWDFGDGFTSTLQTPSHQYANAGVYEVSVTVTTDSETKTFEKSITISNIPIANTINDVIVGCDSDDDGITSFDFSLLDSEVLGSQNDPNFRVHYYESSDDATNATNEIIGLYENTSSPQEIFVRIDNDENQDCFDTTSFFIEVFKKPTANPLDDFPICDQGNDGSVTNGFGEFNLLSLNSQILSNQNPSDFTISYHSSVSDALFNISPLPFTYNNVIPFSETIYIRIENNLRPDCFDTTSTNLVVNSKPDAFNSELIQCDDSSINGFTIFNLNEANNELTGGAENYSTKFFTSLQDAQTSSNEITDGIYSNISNPQTIYVQVIDDNTQCFNISELDIEVLEVAIQNFEAPAVCDDLDSEDGFFTFNLNDFSADILNGSNADISYYETLENALLEQDTIDGFFTNTIAYSQHIYARLENNNDCSNIFRIQLTINELPQLLENLTLYSCLNIDNEIFSLSSGVIGNTSNYSYQWFYNDMDLNLSTHEIQVQDIGSYKVIVSNSFGCMKKRIISLEPSNIATFETIEVSDITLNNSITVFVSGEGTYVYALDAINGPYQESNTFNNVTAGFHTVYVKDIKNNCGIVDEIVSVIGFPRFFTPNGDSINETWNVKGLSEQFLPNSKILIYNRYGKLITELSPLGSGWDGTLNGSNLPSDDYWFVATLEDGRVYRNHFALKR